MVERFAQTTLKATEEKIEIVVGNPVNIAFDWASIFVTDTDSQQRKNVIDTLHSKVRRMRCSCSFSLCHV